MTKGQAALLVVAAMVFLVVGFVIGQIVQAAGTIPGGTSDPLVAQSYVEQAVGEKTLALQNQIDVLQAKVDGLQQKVDALIQASSGGKVLGSTPTNEPVAPVVAPTTPTTPNTSTPVVKPDTKTVTVTGTTARVRKGPGTNYDILVTLKAGDKATYLATKNDWIQIRLPDNREGWIASFLVDVK